MCKLFWRLIRRRQRIIKISKIRLDNTEEIKYAFVVINSDHKINYGDLDCWNDGRQRY